MIPFFGVYIMHDVLFWLYMVNAILLINHEIESAYWKEWRLFRLPGGVTLFLLIHFPLLFIILYGLVELSRESTAGYVFSLITAIAGIFAFCIHTYFIRKGREEFRLPISLFILIMLLLVSMVQAGVTVYLLAT